MVPSKERMTKRHWRTRPDPFSEINDEIQKMLQENPFLSGKQVFNEFQILYPGKFEDKLLRTFQRRVESWRKAKNTVESTKTWMLALLQGKTELSELKKQFSHVLAEKDIVSLNFCILFKPRIRPLLLHPLPPFHLLMVFLGLSNTKPKVLLITLQARQPEIKPALDSYSY